MTTNGPDKADEDEAVEPAADGYKPGGSAEPNDDPETPGGTAATHHPPAEPGDH